MHDILELSEMLVPELREIAKVLNIKRAELLKKQDLIYKILDQQAIDAAEARKTGRPDKPAGDKPASAREQQPRSDDQRQQRQGDKRGDKRGRPVKNKEWQPRAPQQGTPQGQPQQGTPQVQPQQGQAQGQPQGQPQQNQPVPRQPLQ